MAYVPTKSNNEKMSRTKQRLLKYPYPLELNGSKLFSVWANMKTRCLNKKNNNYPNYGGRGITICDKWLEFGGFYQDMGGTYVIGLTLDRIDNDGNYSKENCRWATVKEQANNRRSCKNISFHGMTKTLTQWAEYLGVKKSTMMQRYFSYRWPVEKCLTYKR